MSSPSFQTSQFSHGNPRLSIRQEHPLTYIKRGMSRLKALQLDAALEDFNRAEQLDPKLAPYLWQRGIVYYLMEKWVEGARQFQLDLTVNPNDLEESIWHFLCIARLEKPSRAREKRLSVSGDPRRIMRQIDAFYAGECSDVMVLAVGEVGGQRGQFYSHLYLGLYEEAIAASERSRYYITKAVSDYAIADYMWYVARAIALLRGWM